MDNAFFNSQTYAQGGSGLGAIFSAVSRVVLPTAARIPKILSTVGSLINGVPQSINGKSAVNYNTNQQPISKLQVSQQQGEH